MGRPCGQTADCLSTVGLSLLVLLDTLEVVVECPVGDVVAHVYSARVREAEVDAQPDSCVDDVLIQRLPGVVVAGGVGYCC